MRRVHRVDAHVVANASLVVDQDLRPFELVLRRDSVEVLSPLMQPGGRKKVNSRYEVVIKGQQATRMLLVS